MVTMVTFMHVNTYRRLRENYIRLRQMGSTDVFVMEFRFI